MKRSSYFIIFLLFAFFESDAQKGQYLMLPEFRFIINPDSFSVTTNSSDFAPIPTKIDVYDKDREFKFKISISSGYISGRSSWVYSSNYKTDKIFPRNPKKTGSRNQTSNVTIENSIINGFNFTWRESVEEVCGSNGKEDIYQIYISCDTVFNHSSYVKILVEGWNVLSGELETYRTKIKRILHELTQFDCIDPHIVRQSVQPLNLMDYQKSFEKSIRKNERKCRRHLYFQALRDTSITHDNYLVGCAKDKIDLAYVQECKKNGHRRELADTITQIRKTERIRLWNSIMDLISQKGYSLEHEYRVNQRFSQFQTPYKDYLNALNTNRPQGNLDTIFYYMLLESIKLDNHLENFTPVRYHRKARFTGWNYDIDNYTLPDINRTFSGERLLRSTEEYLIRTIYHNEFGLTSPYRLNYLTFEPTDSTRAYILYANGLDTSSTQYLVTLSERIKFDWKIEIDTLNKQILLDGTEKLTRFNDCYFIETNSYTYILNTATSTATWIQLNTHPVELTRFDFISQDTQFNQDGRYVTPSHSQFTVDMKKLNLHYPEATLENYLPTESDPIIQREIRGKIHREEKKLQDVDLLRTHIARENIPTDKIAFRVDYTLEDLNDDGIDELYSYAISNGTCVYIVCYTSENGRLKQLPNEEAQLWLSSNQNFKNLIIYSQIGMHGNSN
jgi:hypothetical protein